MDTLCVCVCVCVAMAMENTWVGVRLKPMVPVNVGNEVEGAGDEKKDEDVSAWSTSAIDMKTLRYTGPVAETSHHHHHHNHHHNHNNHHHHGGNSSSSSASGNSGAHAGGAGGGSGGHNHHGPQTVWRFDRVFGSHASNDMVYKEAAAALVESALSGVNGTVFAYGQTASGKTHTITSVVDQAAAHIFLHASKDAALHEYRVTYSSLEIYNELVRDLLANGAQLRVMDDAEGNAVVENLTAAPVDSPDALQRLIERSLQTRAVAEHALNKASSRSHHITRFTIERRKRSTEARDPREEKKGDNDAGTDAAGQERATTTTSKTGGERKGEENRAASTAVVAQLNLVDLAGSERHKMTGTSGTTLREGCHINRSLLVLTKVIRALGDRDSHAALAGQSTHGGGSAGHHHQHIPFRESKLTRILQNSLGGNARCAIICTAAQGLQHVEHTRATLSFASRATAVATSATVNVVEAAALQGMGGSELLTKYRDEVGSLKRQLEEIKGNPEILESFQQVREELRREARRRESAEKSVKGYDLLLRASLNTPVRLMMAQHQHQQQQQQQQQQQPQQLLQTSPAVMQLQKSPCGVVPTTLTPSSAAKLRRSWSPTVAADDDGTGAASFLSPRRRRRSIGDVTPGALGGAVETPHDNATIGRSSLVRLSWDAGAGAGETTTSKLDLLAPSCRSRLRKLTERLFTSTNAGVENLLGKMTALDRLSAAMGTEINRKAMEALREEVRCMNVKSACVDTSQWSTEEVPVESHGLDVIDNEHNERARHALSTADDSDDPSTSLHRHQRESKRRRNRNDDSLVERLRAELLRMQAELSAEINGSNKLATTTNASDGGLDVDNGKLETIHALRNEVERLTRDREAERRALDAIAALEMRIEGMYGVKPEEDNGSSRFRDDACGEERDENANGTNEDKENAGEADLNAGSGSGAVLHEEGGSFGSVETLVIDAPSVPDANVITELEEEEDDEIVIVASPVPSPRMKDFRDAQLESPSRKRSILGDTNRQEEERLDVAAALDAHPRVPVRRIEVEDVGALDHASVFCEVRSPSSSPLLQSPCATVEDTRLAEDSLSPKRGFKASPSPRRCRGLDPTQDGRTVPNAYDHNDKNVCVQRDGAKKRAYVSAKRELLNLQSCLSHNKETIERLDCQKKLLLQQVLKLEFAVEDATRDRDANKRQMERMKKEIDSLRRDKEAAERKDWRGGVGMGRSSTTAGGGKSQRSSSPMSEIVRLWHELNVPLRHRSLFLLSADSMATSSSFARRPNTNKGSGDDMSIDTLVHFELMRLQWLARCKLDGTARRDRHKADDESIDLDSVGPQSVYPELARRKRLELERRDLARRMKRKLETADLNACLTTFDIDLGSKKRKQQLTHALWATGQDDMMQRCGAELVHRLLCDDDRDGTHDGIPRLEDVVFGDDV